MTEPVIDLTSKGRTEVPHVVVIGGGITGLAAAWRLTHPSEARDRAARGVQPRVTVLESDHRLGGKIQTTPFAGIELDTGPDAFLARSPYATHLCRELGIEAELVSPTSRKAQLWSRHRLHQFPSKHVLGVPAGLWPLLKTRLVTPIGIARASGDYMLPNMVGRSEDDPSIGAFMRTRLGSEVVDRLIDPLVGGINAGSVDQLSLSAAVPQLSNLSELGRSVLKSTATTVRRRSPDDIKRPLFYALRGGMGVLVDSLYKQLVDGGTEVRLDTYVERVEQLPGARFAVSVANSASIVADAVIVTTPAPMTSYLLADICPEASTALGNIRYASVAMIRLAYASAAVQSKLDGSGYVTVAKEGGLLTACSWASSKWEHVSPEDQVVFRASAGRMQDTRADALTDDELIDEAHKELATSVGARQQPTAADVTRWNSSFPQYEPGHLDRVETAERALSHIKGLSIAGAALHGLGIPACIRNANEAAEDTLKDLASASKTISLDPLTRRTK